MKKGFTLVELLVVISIIAVLSIIGLTLFTDVQKNARDARRKGDVDNIAKAWEANYNSSATNPYLVLSDTMFASGAIPKDPQTGSNYNGVPGTAGASFMVCAALERSTGNANSATGGALGTITIGNHYCRKNAQ